MIVGEAAYTVPVPYRYGTLGIEPIGKDDKGNTLVEVAAGCSMARLLNWAAEQQLSGLEFAAGIPGTVGGAVVMNAGAQVVIDDFAKLEPTITRLAES